MMNPNVKPKSEWEANTLEWMAFAKKLKLGDIWESNGRALYIDSWDQGIDCGQPFFRVRLSEVPPYRTPGEPTIVNTTPREMLLDGWRPGQPPTVKIWDGTSFVEGNRKIEIDIGYSLDTQGKPGRMIYRLPSGEVSRWDYLKTMRYTCAFNEAHSLACAECRTKPAGWPVCVACLKRYFDPRENECDDQETLCANAREWRPPIQVGQWWGPREGYPRGNLRIVSLGSLVGQWHFAFEGARGDDLGTIHFSHLYREYTLLDSVRVEGNVKLSAPQGEPVAMPEQLDEVRKHIETLCAAPRDHLLEAIIRMASLRKEFPDDLDYARELGYLKASLPPGVVIPEFTEPVKVRTPMNYFKMKEAVLEESRNPPAGISEQAFLVFLSRFVEDPTLMSFNRKNWQAGEVRGQGRMLQDRIHAIAWELRGDYAPHRDTPEMMAELTSIQERFAKAPRTSHASQSKRWWAR